jgi:hypothetical protein
MHAYVNGSARCIVHYIYDSHFQQSICMSTVHVHACMLGPKIRVGVDMHPQSLSDNYSLSGRIVT